MITMVTVSLTAVTQTFIDDFAHIFIELFRQVSDDGENDETGEDAGRDVTARYYEGVSGK